MEFLVQRWNAQILGGTPEAKAIYWTATDTEARKRGEQTGLDTLVVHALNDGYQTKRKYICCVEANAISIPPEEYGRKVKTQRN